MDCFLCDNGLRHERVNEKLRFLCTVMRHFFLNLVITHTPANILTFPDLKQGESLIKEDNDAISDF